MILDAVSSSQGLSARDMISIIGLIGGVAGAVVGYIARLSDKQREQLDGARETRLVKSEAEIVSMKDALAEQRVRGERADGDLRVMRTEHNATKAAIEEIKANMVTRPEFEQGIQMLGSKMDLLISSDRGSHGAMHQMGVVKK